MMGIQELDDLIEDGDEVTAYRARASGTTTNAVAGNEHSPTPIPTPMASPPGADQ